MNTKALRNLTMAVAALAATTLTQPASAQSNYVDATSDVFTTAGSGILDIASVEVSNNAFDLIFKITVTGNPVATDWGKYLIGFDTTPGGDTAGDGWGRPILMSQGMDYWVGSWVDGPHAIELYEYDSGWNQLLQTFGTNLVFTTTDSVTLRVPFLTMGLGVGDSFEFDLYTSGGGSTDGAIDALANPNQTVSDWPQSYDSSTNLANPPKSYTIAPSADPTNKVTFMVNMEVPIALFNANFSDPNGFEPGGNLLYVRGNFNGFTTDPAYQLFQVGSTSVYSNTVDVVSAAGSTISYRFYGFDKPGEESPLLLCGNVRTLEISAQVLSAPLAYFNDQSLSDPTNDLTFSVDMSLQAAVGKFSPVTDTVYVAGSFNDWCTNCFALTNNPMAPNSNIWSGTIGIKAPVGACGYEYKFWTDSATMDNSGYEQDPNRTFAINSSNEVLPTAFWNDASPCDVTEQAQSITFMVGMTNATGTDATVYNGTQPIYLNGDFAGWWGWANPAPTVASNLYTMTNIVGTSNYFVTVAFPAGQNLRLEYKYSMNGSDNEAGGSVNHIRYIRTTPGQTNYVLPLDLWINNNPTVPRVEPQLGGLAATPSTPGNVQINYLGLKCATLQSATNVAGPWQYKADADGVGSTTFPASLQQEYYRLSR